MSPDRLTGRDDNTIIGLELQPAGALSFNELIALAGQRLNEKIPTNQDTGRDWSLAHTALEDALTRFNGLCYRLAGTWKRVDPDLVPLED